MPAAWGRIWRRISLRKQIVLAFIIPVAIVILSSLQVAGTLRGLRDTAAATAETSDALRLRYVILNAVVDAESAFRGYLLTANQEFLVPYGAAPGTIRQAMDQLTVTEAEEPEHLARIDSARKAFLAWQTDFAEPLVALRGQARPEVLNALDPVLRRMESGRFDPALLREELELLARQAGSPRAATLAEAAELVESSPARARELVRQASVDMQADVRRISEGFASRRGKRMLDDIRARMGASVEEELDELAARQNAERLRAERARWLVLLAPTLGLIVGLVVTILLLMDAVRGIDAVSKAAARVAGGDLSKRMPVKRSDEIGELAVAFNRMADELADRRRRGEAIARHQSLLAGSNSLEELYDVAHSACRELFPLAGGAIFRISASRSVAERVSAWDWPDPAPAFMEPEECRALRGGRPYYYSSMEGVSCAHTREISAHVRRSLCLPLAAQGEILGILQLAQFGEGPSGPIPQRDHASAMSIAEQLGMAMANLQLRETLRNQSIRDPLTGLYNRRFLEETLARELEKSHRTRAPLSVVVLDVDHFKRFNDTHGHEAGDHALVTVSEVLRSGVRASDVVCRYGGEEFVLLMPDTSLECARERADALREQLAGQPVLGRHGACEPVTFSAGVATAPDDGRDSAVLLANADAALYRAKAAGRNRVLAFRDPTGVAVAGS